MHKVLRTLILSDLFIMSSFGLVQPIFAVFILKNITGASIAAVGIAATVALFARASFQILVSRWTDAEKGNCRELYTLVVGSFIICAVPVGYMFVHSLPGLYLMQFMYGLGQALSYPSWRVIFGNYARREHIGYEWSVYDTVINFGVAAAAALGGYFAEQFSFEALFLVVAAISLVGTSFLIMIFQQEYTCRIHFKKSL